MLVLDTLNATQCTDPTHIEWISMLLNVLIYKNPYQSKSKLKYFKIKDKCQKVSSMNTNNSELMCIIKNNLPWMISRFSFNG